MNSDNIRFMRIFAGNINNSGAIEDVDFPAVGCYVFGTIGNEANIII